MATVHNFDEEMATASAAAAPGDVFLIHELATLLKKQTPKSKALAWPIFAAGSALTLTQAVHGNGIIQLNALAGSTVKLPSATGSGARYLFYVSVIATSNSHIIKRSDASTTDFFIGEIVGSRTDSGNAVLGFCSNGTNHNTITLNRTTTGSVNLGEWVMVEDIAVGIFLVRGFLTATGAAFATPFSNT